MKQQITSFDQLSKSNDIYTRLEKLPKDVQQTIKAIFNAYLDGYQLCSSTKEAPQ